MPQRRLTREAPPDLDAIREDVAEWYALKRQASIVSDELDKRTKRLKAVMQKYGEVEPEHGHIIFELGEPVGEANITSLRNQKRDTPTMNEDSVEDILRDKGMWEEMTEVIRVPDQGRIRAAFFDNRITESELAQMFPIKVSYALYALDDNGKPVKA